MSADLLVAPSPDPVAVEPDVPDTCALHDEVPSSDTGPAQRTSAGSSLLDPFRAPPAEIAFAVCAAALCLLISKSFMVPHWSGRFAVLLALTLPGLAALASQVRARDRAAMSAAAFLGVAAISGLLGGNPRVSLIGQLGQDESVLVLAGFVGVWAIARRLSPGGRRATVVALIMALGVQALAGVLQMWGADNVPPLGRISGRATGLSNNAAFYGALMAGAATFAAGVARGAASRLALIGSITGVLAFSAGTSLSGSRIALAAFVMLALWQIVRAGVRRGSAVAAAAVSGLVGAQLLMSWAGAQAGPTRVISGTVAGGEGRFDVWRYGLRSIAESPLLGAGPGRFGAAIQGDYSAAFLRSSTASRDFDAWSDAHNLGIQLAVTIGVPGVVLFGMFLAWALRRASGPLLLLFAGIALTWLLQPMVITTAPVAFIALGLAAPLTAHSAARGRRCRILVGSMSVAGLLLSGWFVRADLDVGQALMSGSSETIAEAASALPPDALIADEVSRIAAIEVLFDPRLRAHALELAAVSTRLEPERPQWWLNRAEVQLALDDLEGARESLRRAEDLQEWHGRLWPLVLELATRTDDTALIADARSHLCAIDPSGELGGEDCPG